MSVFHAYDIRGKCPQEVNESLYEEIAKAIVKWAKPQKILVGHDMRESSKGLKDALKNTFLSLGVDVIDIGLASTPMVYQATNDFEGIDIGLIVTASHNPKEDNGLKICKKNAIPVSGDSGIKEIEKIVNSKDFPEESNQKGELQTIEDYKDKYFEEIMKFNTSKKKLKVVFDPGNGMGAFIDKEILEKVCELVPLYAELDGTFPNHEANPIKEQFLADLKQKVIEENADLGFAFDGDADRIGFVDEKGNFVPADYMGALLTEHFIKNNPNENIYSTDLRSTKAIQTLANEHGKKIIKTRVGHSYIKEIMRKENSFFSTELSGHFYFWFNEDLVYDSAIRSAIETLNALSENDLPFSELIEKYKTYKKSPETNFSVNDKQKAIQKIKEKYSDANFEEIDGVTLNYSNWWANIRASNTENTLRLNLEADNEEIYNEKYKEICDFLNSQ